MARLPRLSLAGYAHHVIQRGNNRQPIFKSADDFNRMLELIRENAARFSVAIHSYVLMDNHFHLLATPQTDDALPLMMQSLGRSYVRYFNDLHGRTGTLWEGRYKSAVIQTDRYLLACMAYLDLNPVRAGMVAQAVQYRWSSHAHYIGRSTDRLITPPRLVWELGNTPFAREAAYAELVHSGVAGKQVLDLTDATLKGWALGDDEFMDQLQKITPRRVKPALPGRPVVKKNTSKNGF
jgi:putative transposase